MSSHFSKALPYEEQFFSYTTRISLISARVIIPCLLEACPGIRSVVDFGCARGAWLKTWIDHNVDDVAGLDGDYVDLETLLIPRDAFRRYDLNRTIDVGRHFDLAQSLEVAEHLKPENGPSFVRTITRHADYVLFSAAPPGQGGAHHINERPYDYWRSLFLEQGFQAYDCIRPRILDHQDVAFWYKYNTILYVRTGCEGALSDVARAALVPEGESIVDVSPAAFRVRKALIRLMPIEMRNFIARIKARLHS